jgi:tRNA (guanine-N7-)-methyltransferase
MKFLDQPEGFSLPTSNVLQRYGWREIFGNGHPVEIDLGAGDGGFVLERARRHPERNFIAVERLLGRMRKIWREAQLGGLANLRGLRLESGYVLRWLCPEASVAVLHIMFPDPWPKARHHKRRLIQAGFLEDARKALVPGGEVRFSTDHEGYAAWAREAWEKAPGWRAAETWDWEEDPLTEFQRLFMIEGRTTFRQRWVRRD